MGVKLTPRRSAIDEEYPSWLDTTRAPLDAALFDLHHRRILLCIARRRLLDRAGRIEGREDESTLRDGLGRTVLDKVYRAHVDRYSRGGGARLCLARELRFRCVRARCAVRPRDGEDTPFLYQKKRR